MLQDILEFLRSIIEGGFLGQAIIASLIWGAVAYLVTRQAPIDDRLYDAGFIILGYFFHVAQQAVSANRVTLVKREADDCLKELQNGTS